MQNKNTRILSGRLEPLILMPLAGAAPETVHPDRIFFIPGHIRMHA